MIYPIILHYMYLILYSNYIISSIKTSKVVDTMTLTLPSNSPPPRQMFHGSVAPSPAQRPKDGTGLGPGRGSSVVSSGKLDLS